MFNGVPKMLIGIGGEIRDTIFFWSYPLYVSGATYRYQLRCDTDILSLISSYYSVPLARYRTTAPKLPNEFYWGDSYQDEVLTEGRILISTHLATLEFSRAVVGNLQLGLWNFQENATLDDKIQLNGGLLFDFDSQSATATLSGD